MATPKKTHRLLNKHLAPNHLGTIEGINGGKPIHLGSGSPKHAKKVTEWAARKAAGKTGEDLGPEPLSSVLLITAEEAGLLRQNPRVHRQLKRQRRAAPMLEIESLAGDRLAA